MSSFSRHKYLILSLFVFLVFVFLYLNNKTAPKDNFEHPELERKIVLSNESCLSNRPDMSAQEIPVCPSGDGFKLLGNYNPVGGFFLKCGCKHSSNKSFRNYLSSFYHYSKKNFPQIPLTMIVDRSCVSSCYSDFLSDVGDAAKFNTIFINGDERTDYFAQDSYVSGVAHSKFALMSKKQNFGEGCSGFEILDYDLLVKPRNNTANGFKTNVDDRGGNIFPLPNSLVAVGSDLSPEMYKYLESEKNVLVPVEVKYFPARHVDEMLSLVRLPQQERIAPCDFALIVASPKLAFEATQINPTLLKDALSKRELKNLIMEEDASIQKSLQMLQEKIMTHLGCKQKVPVIYFPIFWAPYIENGLTLYKDAWPNPVNALVVGQNLLIPDPQSEALRTEISTALKKFKLKAEFMDSTELQDMYGGIHCATKSLHICRTANAL